MALRAAPQTVANSADGVDARAAAAGGIDAVLVALAQHAANPHVVEAACGASLLTPIPMPSRQSSTLSFARACGDPVRKQADRGFLFMSGRNQFLAPSNAAHIIRPAGCARIDVSSAARRPPPVLRSSQRRWQTWWPTRSRFATRPAWTP